MPRVLITRAPHQASALAEALRALDCEPILVPTIELVPPVSFAALDDALANLDRFHWLIFTSANAVEAFAQRARTLAAPHLDFEMWATRHRTLIAAIGPATARALEVIGLHADLVPPQAVAESLTAALRAHALQPDGTPTRFLLIRAEAARDHLPETLHAAGADVTIAPAYRTVVAGSSIGALQEIFRDPSCYPDAITFTSGSTVTNLLALLEMAGVTLPSIILRVSIGPITSQTLREHHLPPHVESVEASIASLARSVKAACDAREK
jgi:uroporphyrinogen-III synthase